MANSADPDQLASEEANLSGSTLLAKAGYSGFSRTRVRCYSPAFFFFFLYFSGKIKLGISSESSARQTIPLKCQVLFSLKTTNYKSEKR